MKQIYPKTSYRTSVSFVHKPWQQCLLLLLVFLTFGVGNAWATYTITFSGSSSESTTISTSTTAASITGSSSYVTGNVATATKVYGATASDGIKLGASSNAGTIKINLSSSGQVTPTSIVVNCKLYNSSKAATLKVNGSATQNVPSSYGDLTFNITSAITYIQLESNKYIWVKSVTVNTGSTTKTFTLKVPDGTGGYTTYNNKEKSYLTQTTAEGGNSCGGGLDGTYSGWRLNALETPNASPGTTYNSSTADGTLPSSGSTLYAVFRQTSGSYYYHTNPLCAAVKTLSSIAITTAPTTTKYLVGETFSSTGAVVTATYTDATTATVSATWTPTTGLTAGSNTITASYTEGGVTKTATTTVTAYAVTVQKQDTEGNTISAAGVTATASGRSLTASVGSTKYVFKTWKFGTNSGTSISNATSATTGSLTGTPSAAVTVIAEFYKPFTVTWSVNGSTSTISATTNVAYNTTVTMPTPSVPQDCNGSTFMGWTTSTNANYSSDSAPSPLYSGTSPAITDDVTYYAVFAEEQ